MAIKRHNMQWLGVWRESTKTYTGFSAIRSGDNVGYNSLLGFNSSAILADIKSSKVKARVHLKFNVTRSATFDLGMHRTTSNPKSDGIPYYAWAGRSFFPSLGLASYDITEFPRSLPNSGGSTFRSALENGYHGPVLYGAMGATYGIADEAWIEVEGTWNDPPKAGSVTYPVGGETLNETITMRATAGSDPNGDSLTYQFALRDADGYHYFPRQSGLNRSVNLSDYKETSSAQVAVRAWDGQAYSAWAYSGIFTIQHNTAPSQPRIIEPTGGATHDRTQDIVFRWEHRDSDPQSAYTFRWRVKGASAWNSTRVNSTNNFRYVSGNTFPNGEIEWQVMTEDQGSLKSSYSTSGIFNSTEQSDAPTILSPANNEIITSEELSVTWSSGSQNFYEIEVSEGGNVVYSTWRIGGNKGITVPHKLLNNSAYQIRVRTRDTGELWSAWDSISITTSFTPPPQPEISISLNEEISAIILNINNPLPTTDEPDVVSNSIYRREPEGEWIKIAESVPPNGNYLDATVAGGIIYEYYATANGDNQTSMDGVPVIGSINFRHVILSHPRYPDIFIRLKYNGSLDFSLLLNGTKKQYSGRKLPVTEFGEVTEWEISTNYLIEKEEYRQLVRMVKLKETLLFRDDEGRKHFVTTDGLSVPQSNVPGMYAISLNMSEVDYQEGVE